MRYNIKMFLWCIANKRFLKDKNNVIDTILLHIVNRLNK